MAWQDRIRGAAYTSPSGARLTFIYEDVSEAVDRKTSAYTFADADGTYIQDLGTAGRRYPLRVILSGKDYDTEAEAWMNALTERGEGTLEHPIHGIKTVIPTGTIKRRDDLVRTSNQAIIEVEFFETIGTAYPTSTADAASQGTEAVEDANEAQAAALVESGALDDAAGRTDFLADFNGAIDTARDKIAPIAAAIEGAQRVTDAIEQSINRAIDVLIRDPLTLATQFQELLRAPARLAAIGTARLEAYADLARGFIQDRPATRAGLASADLSASAALAATIEAANNTTFLRRANAIESAENIMALLEDVGEWRDQAFEDLDVVDTGGSWQATQAAAAIVAGKLVGASFGLPSERRLVLTSDRSLIDMVYELYGTVDDALDDFINDNDLNGDQIIELPRGFEVVYYAD